MKITKDGEVFVRRLVHGGAEVKDAVIPAASITESGAVSSDSPRWGYPKSKSLSKLLAPMSTSPRNLALLLSVASSPQVVAIASQSPADVVVILQDAVVSLPVGVSSIDAAFLTASFLASWIGLVVRDSIKSSSIVLSTTLPQLRSDLAVECYVLLAETAALSSSLEVPMSDIIAIDNFATAILGWLRSNSIRAFDIVLNAGGERAFAHGADLLSVFGSYIHIEGNELSRIPSGSYSTQVSDINRFAAASPVLLAPFRLHLASFSSYSSSQVVDAYSLVAIPDSLCSVRIDPVGQLFDPRKSYILVGGSSELGVCITEWMANHGARRVFLTSRGPRGPTKVDNLYIYYLRSKGMQIEAIAADAIGKDQTAAVVERAKKAGPIGGLFVV
ncbi:hypothetical protein BKA82DRAFT_11030, partial [Pisolithus tinctorius]